MGDTSRITRREFVKAVVGSAAAASLGSALGPLASAADPEKQAGVKGMPTRNLGRTGHAVRLLSLGGQATLEQPDTEEQSLAIIHRAIDLGVNYIDTARRYGQGISETYIGKVLATRRREVFLASKTHDRSYDGSMRLLEQSLKQLQTDHLDLWQCHNVMTEDDLTRMFARDGVMKAMEKARDQKLVRFFGITGHYDPSVLRHGIERYPFDTILVALNAADRHRASFIENLLPTAVEKKMGIIGMKVPARGRLFREGGITKMKDAMSYVLTLPVSTVIVGIGTLAELEENVAIATGFQPLAAAELRRLEGLVAPYAEDAMTFKMPA